MILEEKLTKQSKGGECKRQNIRKPEKVKLIQILRQLHKTYVIGAGIFLGAGGKIKPPPAEMEDKANNLYKKLRKAIPTASQLWWRGRQ